LYHQLLPFFFQSGSVFVLFREWQLPFLSVFYYVHLPLFLPAELLVWLLYFFPDSGRLSYLPKRKTRELKLIISFSFLFILLVSYLFDENFLNRFNDIKKSVSDLLVIFIILYKIFYENRGSVLLYRKIFRPSISGLRVTMACGGTGEEVALLINVPVRFYTSIHITTGSERA